MTEREKADAAEDLRSTAHAIAKDVHEMAQLEAEKLRLDPTDERIDVISREVYRLAGEVRTKARAELELSEIIEDGDGGGGASPAARK